MHVFYQGITDFIFIENEPEPSDMIFVPGGHYPESVKRAAALYRNGLAPFILPSGKYSILNGKFDGPFDTEWEYLSSILREEGVPEKAILKEDKAEYTYENAVFSRQATDLLGLRISRAMIVCQAFHARRCLMYYQEQFPETELLVCPVQTKGLTKDNWFMDDEKIDIVLGEVERCGTQFHQIMKNYRRQMEKEK